MVNNMLKKLEKKVTGQKKRFNPFHLISDETFETNLNAIIVYYQMTRGKNHSRFRAA